MLLLSPWFYGALAGAVAVYYAIPAAWRIASLLLFSCLFYLVASPFYFVLLAVQTAIAYAAGRRLATATTDRARSIVLVIALIPILGVLVFLKVKVTLVGILMPLGVSYYTFKIISYLMEVYWDESQVETRPVNFAAYVAFASQIVSGPVQRPFDFFPQLAGVPAGKFDMAVFQAGCLAILEGLLLKLLIADRLGGFIATVDAAPAQYSHAVLTTLAICYTVWLYADFAGYTLIAIGLGRLFGIEGPPNFNAPFLAPNIQEFWRRWHISLSSWVADYLFTPLLMSMRQLRRIGMVASLLISMGLIGIWHGPTATFLIFGLLHGVYLSVSGLTLGYRERLFEQRPQLAAIRRAIAPVVTFLLMTFSQLFWQARSLGSALLHIKLLAGVVPSGELGFRDIGANLAATVFVCMAISVYHGCGTPGAGWLRQRIGGVVPAWAIGAIGLLLLATLATERRSNFIYAQF